MAGAIRFVSIPKFGEDLLNEADDLFLDKGFQDVAGNLRNDLTESVVPKTRARTGQARGGWIGSIKVPTEARRGNDKGGQSTIAAAKRVFAAIEQWDDAFLQNPVPHAWLIEHGDRNRAGDKMLASAVNEIEQKYALVE